MTSQPRRFRLTVPPRGRTVGQRLALRFPRVVHGALAPALRLEPGSSVRRAVLSRFLRGGYQVINRRDVDVAAALVPPDYEMHIAQDGPGPGAGVKPLYRGRAGVYEADEDFLSAFEWLRYEPDEVIDLGDRVVVLLNMASKGRGSGVESRQTLGIVYELVDGRFVRERHFWEWPNALASVGVSTRRTAADGP